MPQLTLVLHAKNELKDLLTYNENSYSGAYEVLIDGKQTHPDYYIHKTSIDYGWTVVTHLQYHPFSKRYQKGLTYQLVAVSEDGEVTSEPLVYMVTNQGIEVLSN